MHLTLINPPWFFSGRLEFLSQNLGLAYLGAALREAGHEVFIMDAVAEAPNRKARVQLKYQTLNRWGLSYPEIIERIPEQTQAIGITAPFTNTRLIVKELSAAIKERFANIPILLGGVFPSTLPEEALYPSVDYVVRGEGERSLVQFANGSPPDEIPGFMFKRDGKIVDGGAVICERDLDSLPFPARDLLPMERYLGHSPRGLVGRRSAAMITSRGCPFNCSYCSVHPVAGRLWRPRSVESVLDEIDHLIDRYQVNHIEFEDDNMTIDLDRAKAIVKGIIDRRRAGYPITWENPNGLRTETLDEEFIALCRESGNRTLYLPVEHGSPEMLQKMDKRQNLEAVERVIQWCGKHGIRTVVFFITGYPGETECLWREGWAYARRLKDLGASRFEVFLAKPYPGTKMYEECEREGYLVYPDGANVVYEMDFAGVQCPEFTPEEAIRRRRVMKRNLNPWFATMKSRIAGKLPSPLYHALKRLQESWIGPGTDSS